MKNQSTPTILHLAGKMKRPIVPITSRAKCRRRSLRSSIGFGAISILVIAAALYTDSSASSSNSHQLVKTGAERINKRPDVLSAGLLHNTRFIASGEFFALLMPQLDPPPPPPETIATYSVAAGLCTNIPKNTFVLGETVCAKVSNAPLRPGSPLRHVNWTNTKGFVVDSQDVTSDPQEFQFTLPSDNTSVIDGTVIDNRGTWSASINSTGDNLTRAIAYFKVSDPENVAADLVVYETSTSPDPVPPGSNTGFYLWVGNTGPDAAQNVHVTQATPPYMTFLSTTQHSGPPFTCTNSSGVTDCTIPILPSGEKATITINYSISSGAPNGVISSTTNISSDTNDPRPDNNSSQGQVEVRSAGAPPATCSLSCPPDITATADTTEGGERGAHVTYSGSVEVSGDCGTISFSPASGSFFPEGTHSVTVTSSTGGGSCSFTVTVIDSPGPTITCPEDKTAVAPSGQTETSVETGTPEATGTGVSVTGIRNDNRDVSDPYPVGVTTITWRATDSDGRVASCDQRITVTSADAPTITCPSNKTFTAPSGECSYTATSGEIGSPTTNGSNVTVTGERSDGLHLYDDPYPAGQTFITWTATDDAGRTASCTQRITVNATDTEPPVLTVPPDVNTETSSCTATVDDELGVATATDNCSSSVNITRSGVPTFSCPTPSDPNRQCESFVFPTGTTIITYTATDSAGNSTTGTQRVVVTENPAVPPTVMAPSDVTVNTGPGATSCGAHVDDATLGTATADDNCPGVTVTRSGVPTGNNFPVGETLITYTATDRAGNIATDTQKVTVVDDTAPVVSCPADITQNTDPGSCTANLDPGTATATDNCGSATVTGTRSDNQPLNAPYPKGTTIITWTATDASNNSSSCTQTITVNDAEPPTISCPADITTNSEPGTCAAHVNPGTATASDNCGTTTVTGTRSDNRPLTDTYPVGTTTITWTATDGSGNQSSCTQTVTVVDNEAPTITLNGQTKTLWPPNHNYHTFNVTDFVTGVADNCGTAGINNVVIAQVTSDESENGNGDGNTNNDIVIAANCKSVQLRAERQGSGNGRVYKILFRVRDAAGNTTTATGTVVVPKNPNSTVVDSGPHYTVTSSCP